MGAAFQLPSALPEQQKCLEAVKMMLGHWKAINLPMCQWGKREQEEKGKVVLFVLQVKEQ